MIMAVKCGEASLLCAPLDRVVRILSCRVSSLTSCGLHNLHIYCRLIVGRVCCSVL